TFHVKVSTSPKGALLSLDGAAVENPYEASLALGPHHFRAQAGGFRAVERTVTQTDTDVTLTLERVTGGEPVGLPAAHPKKPHRDIDDTDPYKK
ncbi:MAG: PEGA domain-containing protein, partial [Spirochaetaceae bacterium]|nr:PEGA domain-containing protein [Spirochaetaceae bacterium]